MRQRDLIAYLRAQEQEQANRAEENRYEARLHYGANNAWDMIAEQHEANAKRLQRWRREITRQRKLP